jgi:glycine oxidase
MQQPLVTVDYLIVGQGIAGTFLSHFLLRKGKSVLVADVFNPHSSSRVAAGIFNPITGRKFTRTWMADRLFPFAEKAYTDLEALLGEKFYCRKEILRPFSGEKEKNDISGPATENAPYISGYTEPGSYRELNDGFGGVVVSPAGFVEVKKMLGAYRAYLISGGLLREERVDCSLLRLDSGGIRYRDIQAGMLIFCEGAAAAADNPYFSYLPFARTKGELLTVKISGYGVDRIVSKGIFILPLGNSLYRVGATYDWKDFSDVPTEKARQELVAKLEKVIRLPFEVLDHQASVRPTVRDRRPLLGIHPVHSTLGILNGLGTKGVSLGPYFAYEMAEHLTQGTKLNEEADIRRFSGS